jgi:hypothetical protein
MLQQARRTAKTKGIHFLKNTMSTHLDKVAYYVSDPAINDVKEGTIQFDNLPHLGSLVAYGITDRWSLVVLKGDLRLESLEIRKSYPFGGVTVLTDDGKRVKIKFSTLVEALSLLLKPSVFREYAEGRVKIASEDPDFEDFVDTVIDFVTLVVSEDKHSLVKFEDLFGKYMEAYSLEAVIQYPGINFDFLSLRYEKYSEKLEVRVYDSYLTEVLSFGILGHHHMSVSYSLAKKLPAFQELVNFVESEVPKLLHEYREAVKLAYLGVKAYEG